MPGEVLGGGQCPASCVVRRASCVVRCASTFSNDNYSKANGPILTKLHRNDPGMMPKQNC